MRITSPKNIPSNNSRATLFNLQSKISQNDNQPGANSREAFHSHQNSIHGGSLTGQYNLGDKRSQGTETYISNRRGRSRSNHHGISMSRDKTIKMDNIYEPEHFALNKNSQDYSTKSITSASNRNIKSVSRLTRATSPTITSYPQRKSSQYSVNDKASTVLSTKELSQSYGQDTFDFKQLKKELNHSDQYEKQRIADPTKNQDYYGRAGQLTENRYFLTHNKQSKAHKESSVTSDYDLNRKIIQKVGSRSKGLTPSIAPKESSLTSDTESQHLERRYGEREKGEDSFFSSCTNSKSHKFIASSRQTPTMKPNSPLLITKLGWRDVIKK